MKVLYRVFTGITILVFSVDSFAQNCELSGKIFDSSTEERLALANVFYGEGQGVNANVEGEYTISIPYGTYKFEFTFVGYTSKFVTIDLNKPSKILDVGLLTIELEEALVLADMAIDRETPVAFSNIDAKTIEEELASQDIPMILNSTPGVYATQSGGGDGDARITIRGFSQRNVAVMLDGVPVNDMENGWVYWSNWFGLDAIMQTTQVQRGLGVSKIAVPSVGGTINILTKGIEQKKNTRIKQEVAGNGFLRTTVGHTSGRLKGNWGFTLAGSYKQGDGWVTGNWTKGFFYYAKVQKAVGNHIFTLSGFGAPQSHGQRSYKEGIHIYDQSYANGLGINTSEFPEFGLRYNIHAGQLTRYDLDANGQKVNEKTEDLNERKNYYHKPQFTFKHSWSANDKLTLNNVAYLSVGNGGGTRLDRGANLNEDGTPNFQEIYDEHTGFSYDPADDPFGIGDPSIETAVSETERIASKNYLYSNVNNHFWYGLLSSFRYKPNANMTFSGGLDARHYKGEHYREVYDLFGADYILYKGNPNASSGISREGDIIDFHNDNIVEWGGLFGQVEYKKNLWSGFFSTSYAMTRYQRIEYMDARSLTIDGVEITPYYKWEDNAVTPELEAVTGPDGVIYTPESAGLEYQTTDWFYKGGFTLKTGFNRKITEKHNVFVNLGFLSLAPKFNNIFYRNNDLLASIENENIEAIELGYGYRKHNLSVNFNSYLTIWQNRPFPGGVTIKDPNDPLNEFRANINGMDARHMGVEVEASWAVSRKLTLEGVISFGDWIWNSEDTVFVFNSDQQPVIDLNTGRQVSQAFDARGVHVGDAAQTQLGALVRYEIKKGAYVKLRLTHFDRYYADFNPTELNGDDAGRESWKLPSYYLVDLHAGYRFKLAKKSSLSIRGSILNLLDNVYVSDASDSFELARYNDYLTGNATGFDAGSSAVFFGQGTRFNVSATLNF